MDTERLHSDIIKSHLRNNPTSTEQIDPDGLLQNSRHIYILETGNLQQHVLQYLHDHPLAGHFGQTKTLHAVCMHHYWPGPQAYIKDYCKLCTTCSHAKPVHHRPYGLLKQLPVPEKPWNSISLDFIEKLLSSSSGYTAILVIVDRMTKQGLFIPTHNMITSQQLVQLFVPTSSPNMASRATSLLIEDLNSYHTFSSPLESHST